MPSRRQIVSYRDLEEMMCERGVSLDHTTIYRWVQRYAPKMEKRLRWCWRPTALFDRQDQAGIMGEVRLIERNFGLYPV
jgi:hypothetical protein